MQNWLPRLNIPTVFDFELLNSNYRWKMERRAAIPPGLPKPNPTLSYWQDPPAAVSNHRSSPDLPAKSPIVILGSGITGATAAFFLLNHPSPPSVVMLEARTACSGATGRNGGHTKHASYRSFLDNLRAHGEDEAARIARFEYNCMRAVHAFAADHEIRCDSWQGNTVDIIYDEGQWHRAKTAVAEMKRVLGVNDPAAKYTFWSSEEAEQNYLANGALGAVSYEAGSLSAYKFVIGMLNLALQKGLNLQTNTPALSVTKASDEQGKWIIDTPRGSIRSEKVILATNGYTAHLYPAFQGTIVPLRGHMTAQRPGSYMPKGGLSTTYSFIYDDGYEYMISRPQGSKDAGYIMIGGGLTKAADEGLCEFGNTDDATTEPIIEDYLKKSTERYYGQHWGEDSPDGRVCRSWSGIMGYSSDGYPFVGEIPNEKCLYVAASFQGLGMVLCFYSAKVLVQMLTGGDEGALDECFPKSFRMSADRLNHKFAGRLHTKAPIDLELQSQA